MRYQIVYRDGILGGVHSWTGVLFAVGLIRKYRALSDIKEVIAA